MSARLSRRKLATYAADSLSRGDDASALLRELAAYLVETKTTREADLLVAAIEDELQTRGIIIADVTTARPLSAELKKSVKAVVGGKELHIRERVDSAVIGGVRIELPDSQLDGTIQHKLIALKGAKQ